MEPSNSKLAIAVPSRRPSRRLLFDRRYGWVVDEWKHPSEEALAGGRGMFCIVPLAKACWNMASKSIDAASNCVVEVVQRPDLLSPQAIQATLKTQLSRFQSSLCNSELNLLVRDSKSRSPELPNSHIKLENNAAQTN